jgi:hypothetical protein
MESSHNNFHGMLFWILNGKENKTTGTICVLSKDSKEKIKKIVMDRFHQILTEVMLEIGFVSEERILFLLYFFNYFLP